MRRALFAAWPLAFLMALSAAGALAAGMAHSANFIILADDKALAKEALQQAEQFRRAVAQEWLGEELPPSVGRAVITVRLDDRRDEGLTWAVDRSSSPGRKYHQVWVTGRREQVLGGVLKHEIAHAVFATQFPHRLPAFLDEGIASQYDDDDRRHTRAKLIGWFARTGNWPRLRTLLASSQIVASDKAAYSVAASVTEFLLRKGDKAKLLRFAEQGARSNWDAALRRVYGIRDVDTLQSQWQKWAAERPAASMVSRASRFDVR